MHQCPGERGNNRAANAWRSVADDIIQSLFFSNLLGLLSDQSHQGLTGATLAAGDGDYRLILSPSLCRTWDSSGCNKASPPGEGLLSHNSGRCNHRRGRLRGGYPPFCLRQCRLCQCLFPFLGHSLRVVRFRLLWAYLHLL